MTMRPEYIIQSVNDKNETLFYFEDEGFGCWTDRHARATLFSDYDYANSVLHRSDFVKDEEYGDLTYPPRCITSAMGLNAKRGRTSGTCTISIVQIEYKIKMSYKFVRSITSKEDSKLVALRKYATKLGLIDYKIEKK